MTYGYPNFFYHCFVKSTVVIQSNTSLNNENELFVPTYLILKVVHSRKVLFTKNMYNFFQSDFTKEEVDSNWIHEKLPQSLVKSMSMLKNGGMATDCIITQLPTRNSFITGGTALDFKLATLRNEMVSILFYFSFS